MPQQVLFRESLGDVLRGERMRRGMTLRELSAAARVSLGYISEIERGQKEASSELLGALCEALDVPLSDVLRVVSDHVALEEAARELHVVDGSALGAAPAAGPEVVASAA
ncbi:MAG TPA: helix-turn-helix transcriptional regulator [Marmoricola sp.]